MRTREILKNPNIKVKPKQNLIGKTFNLLTVLEQGEDYVSPKGKRQVRWLCQCNCENKNIVLIAQNHLVSGKIKSCGCLMKHRKRSNIRTEKAKNNINIRKYQNGILQEKCCSVCKQWKTIEHFNKDKNSIDEYNCECKECRNGNILYRYANAKNSAKRRKIKFNLTFERFQTITSEPCFYCGFYNGYYNKKGYSGIDRIDSSKGYTVENSIPCCRFCNCGKNILSLQDFIKHINKITNYFKVENFQEILKIEIKEYNPKKLSCASNIEIKYHYNDKGEPIEKQCKLCLKFKTLDNFYKRKIQKDGYNTICNECRKSRIEERFLRYKNSAKERGFDFELNLNEFFTLISIPCIYCGSFDRQFLGKFYTGIDRVDTKQGYILNNCVPCCFTCNSMKLNSTWEEFILRANYINNKVYGGK